MKCSESGKKPLLPFYVRDTVAKYKYPDGVKL